MYRRTAIAECSFNFLKCMLTTRKLKKRLTGNIQGLYRVITKQNSRYAPKLKSLCLPSND